jgi:hypothetical protein
MELYKHLPLKKKKKATPRQKKCHGSNKSFREKNSRGVREGERLGITSKLIRNSEASTS